MSILVIIVSWRREFQCRIHAESSLDFTTERYYSCRIVVGVGSVGCMLKPISDWLGFFFQAGKRKGWGSVGMEVGGIKGFSGGGDGM